MTKRFIVLTGVAAIMMASGGSQVAAQPYPHYWMSVSTSSQNMPGMSPEMAGMASMFGGGSAFGPRRDLVLQLESPRTVTVTPEAFHEIPSALNMGRRLPLITPRQEKPQRHEGEYKPGETEKTRIRMLYYWGCGENIGAGQPRIFDSEKSKPEEMAHILRGVAPTVQTPPVPHKGWTFGEWPNADERQTVPRDASLVGEHRIRGNYTVDIPFRLDERRDFMRPVEFTAVQTTSSGATRFEWKGVPAAIGYFATAVGSDGKGGDMIMWSASEVPENGMALMDYLTPGDVHRFIRERIIMDPARTSCTVPPIFKDSAGAMLQFIAYGEQLDIVHPPKPKDPREFWQPEWAVKVRLKSTTMAPLGIRGDDGEHRKPRASSRSSKPDSRMSEKEPVDNSYDERRDPESRRSRGGAVGDALRGVFGF